MSKWVKGQSGNPGGRPKLPEIVRDSIQQNGAKGAARMQEILDDETAWGANGWLDPKTQVKLAEVAIVRAYGQQPLHADEGGMAGELKNLTGMLRGVYDALADSGAMPELVNARPADRAKLVGEG